MTKKMTATLALVFVLSTAGTVLAAENSATSGNDFEQLNARISALEKKDDDRVQLSGTVRMRYDHEEINNVNNENVDRHVNLELVATAKINKDWNAVAKWEGNKKLFGTSQTRDKAFDLEKLYITGPIGGNTLTAGKFGWVPGYGITWDNDSTGAAFTFGDKVKTTIFAGEPEDIEDITGYGFHSTYAVTPKTNVGLLVYGTNSDNSAFEDRTVYELGFDTKLNRDYKLTTAYAKSNASDQNQNYKIQFDYKGADSKVENSYGAYVKYAKCEELGGIKPGGDIDPNQKGVQVGFDYVPMVNSKLSVWYFDKQFITTGIDDTKYRVQMEFYF